MPISFLYSAFAVESLPVYVTRNNSLCVPRPPMAKYIAPSVGLMHTSVSGSGVRLRNSSLVAL